MDHIGLWKPLRNAFVLLFSAIGINLAQTPALSDPGSLDPFNYILGTQTFGVKYSFTDKSRLVETAQAIRDMGSNHLKFCMSPQTMKSQYSLPDRVSVKSLTDLAQNEPSVRTVLDMPFAYYHIWVSCFGGDPWQDGLTDTESEGIYREMHDFTVYLLKRYNGSGKTFFLGHWEGDWYLHPGYDRNKTPDPKAIKGMIDWLNIRQKAIDDAKTQTLYIFSLSGTAERVK
jgi:hypothetical protein